MIAVLRHSGPLLLAGHHVPGAGLTPGASERHRQDVTTPEQDRVASVASDARRIGSLAVSVVGLGCNNFGGRVDYAGTAAVVGAALDAGVTLFDTADIYGKGASEEFLGRALAGRRHEVVLATKFGRGWGESGTPVGVDAITRALEDSLRRLRTDYIDLYQLHRPLRVMPLAAVMEALDRLVRSGKVREIGCSSFSVAQLRAAAGAAAGAGAGAGAGVGAGARFVSVQNEFSLVEREPEEEGVLAECERLGLAFLPYFPLAGGLLSGKYRLGQPQPAGTRLETDIEGRFLNDRNLARVEALSRFAAERGRTLLELAVSWLLAHGAVTSVIAGATSAAQVRANVAAGGWRLSAEEL
ncbi:MAG TPA: aldo/keto reductase, partial [Gemmatimonadales bacterium]|nr:aldo/keto reductase [Gemmatimonadales bacterium]